MYEDVLRDYEKLVTKQQAFGLTEREEEVLKDCEDFLNSHI